MFSHYLLQEAVPGQFSIFRPFGMLGKFEDETKIFPALILAQKNKRVLHLSAGTQLRDYIWVSDLGRFINLLILQDRLTALPPLVNVGSGSAHSLKDLAKVIADFIPDFNPIYWNWDQWSGREGEPHSFYSESDLASKLGMELTPLSQAFRETVIHYMNQHP